MYSHNGTHQPKNTRLLVSHVALIGLLDGQLAKFDQRHKHLKYR